MTDKKYRETARVLENARIASDVYSLRLQAPRIAAAAQPGQFVSVYCKDASRLLPRPISVCETDPEAGVLRLVFRTVGRGTEEFSRWQSGEHAVLTGPLGNGFPVEQADGKRVLLFGGGIGIPPMLQLARALSGRADVTAVLGFRDEQFLTEDLAACARVVIATEDGSAGTRGNVLDAVRGQGLAADAAYACGPIPMLRAIQAYAREQDMACWLSLEEKMACGIGACLSCVCTSKQADPHSRVCNKRVCTEGPVFAAEDVVL